MIAWLDALTDLLLHLFEGDLGAAHAKLEERAAIRAARAAADAQADKRFGPEAPDTLPSGPPSILPAGYVGGA